ncbi:nucleoside triphosphate pyrophosphohydrolase family protein [Salinivibrio sp. ML290]|uniref:nucleoside triphosphate pyrophosphohydrolase family protein n=1 Tax=Salinivibrio sp. ML290 TaxID=1909468 RepID=UPI0009887DDC|nr:nucleoside triphosphate pyrophosphohydrolase family protein [Salinivibrio sp. ML290]OOE74701.1 SAM-dependent methyltransferase [Salinivibrio sp. ML290]
MKFAVLDQAIYDHLYRDIEAFRTTFDLPCNDPDSLDDKADDLHTALAVEEMTELAEADSLVEQVDAIVDSVYVLMGRAVQMGARGYREKLEVSYMIDILLQIATRLSVDFVTCWDEVHSSNMSKVCRNQQEFADTQAFYAQKGIDVVASPKEDGIIAKCAADVSVDGKLIREGKVMKSVYYRPADLAKCVMAELA